tara:strand:+ start:236 stop:1216 length:981 start_codon:yes stop_codon:yes gene_type:complete
MAFQDKCGTIVIDAVLTDIGRQKLARGNFRISKFALGDDEVDYSLVVDNAGTWELPNNPPILEAFGTQCGAIKFGLLNLPRTDVLYLPIFKSNQIIENAAKKYGGFYYLSVNKETTDKLKTDIGSIEYVLENDKADANFILVESGIDNPDNSINQSSIGKERFITNLGLMDDYVFLYCDGRLISKVLSNREDSFFRNDAAGNLYSDFLIMEDTIKISIDPTFENFETYYIKTVNNEIYDDFTSSISSIVDGPRGMAVAFNFKVNNRMINDSNSERDERYVTFGKVSETLFGGSNKYDYIDTGILVEGSSTGMQQTIPLRIIRYAGT